MRNQKLIRDIIMQVPDACGVYLMLDAFGCLIYVGKANSLRNRLSSYLAKDLTAKTRALMRNVVDIKFRLTANETSALLLEAGLIHEFKPKYNVSLRDDKSFSYVCITGDKFPRIFIVRRTDKVSGRLLGPYTSAKLLKDALKSVRRIFPFRSCSILPKWPCVYSRINLCPAPCVGEITSPAYARLIEKIILCLEGKTAKIISDLKKMMREKSLRLDFEGGALLRDRINALSLLGESADARGGNDLGLFQLQKMLSLRKAPRRIEGFDISNLSGLEAVGSLVSFLDGRADKNNYRRFRIKGVFGIDDYAMLTEVLHRRYSRILREGAALPDLILLDGGKGHLQAGLQVCNDLRLNIPLVSIAKEQENIYSSQKGVPLKFTNAPEALNLIRRIRDEAHRFAVAYHHVLRRKKVLKLN